MVYELLDYQILAIFGLGFCVGMLVYLAIDDYGKWSDRPRREYLRHIWRSFLMYDDEPRSVRSEEHYLNGHSK